MVKNRQENESGAEEENVEDISLNLTLSEKAVANGEGQGSLSSHSHKNHHHQNNNVVVVDNDDSPTTTTTSTTTTASHSDDAKKNLNGGINSSTTITTPDSCNNHKQKHYIAHSKKSLIHNENHHSQVPDRHKNENEEKDDFVASSDDGVDQTERPTLALRNSMTNHDTKLNENGNATVTTEDNDDSYELTVRSNDTNNPKSKADLTITSQMSTTSTLSEFTDSVSVSENEEEEEEHQNFKTEDKNYSQTIQQAHNSRSNNMRAIINKDGEISTRTKLKGSLEKLPSPDSSVQFYIGNSSSNTISPEEIVVVRKISNDLGAELCVTEIVEKNEIVPRHSPVVKCGNSNFLRKRASNEDGRDNLAFITEDDENSGATTIDISQIRCEFRNGLTRKELSAEGRFPEKNLSVQEENLLDNLQRTFIRDLRKQIYLNASQDGVRLETFIKLFQKKELLRKLFDLFDYNQHQKLCQDEWIEFLKSRLNTEERQVDFVEVLESVSYAVCGDEDVDFEQFCAIFRTKNVLNKFFRLIDRDLDGIVTSEQVMEFISQLSSASTNSRLTKENIQWLEKLFRQYVGDGKEIRKEDFNKIIQTKNQFFTDRVFDIFDKDASGSISLHEFLDAMHQFAGTEPDDKIRFLFKVYDVDGDGVIQCEELGKVMRACMEENGMKFSDDQIHELTMALFEDADVGKQGALTYEALKAQLEKHTGLLENLSISIERWLVPPKKVETSFKTKINRCIPHQFSLRYLKNNYVYLVWLLIFIFTNVGLFVSKSIKFRESHPDATVFLVLARAAGQCLNFNCTFIVIVMLRQCLTFLRARGASMFLPIDQHIYFHKMTGWLIFLFSFFHTVMHLINIEVGILEDADQNQPLEICENNKNLSCPINSRNWTYFQFLFDPVATSQIGIFSMGLIPGYAFNSGVVLVIILTTMVICSLPFVRRGGCFEVFYWTHLMYFLFWALLIIHAPNFWKWFIVPGIIFFIEQALRYYHWRMGRGRTCVSSGILLPSKVTHLVIRRPFNFEFRPGDYVFVRIPTIAKFEWHPFTISSAPEQDDALWLHIRAAGQWTTRLYEYFENEQEKLNCIGSDYPDVNRSRFSPDKPPKKKYYATTGMQKELREVGIMNDKSRKVDLKSIEPRQRLPTVGVGDSVTTVNPSSSASSLNDNESPNDVFTSVDTVSETDAIIKRKKLPIKPTNKPKLTSTKSLPNVHERMLKREVKMNLRNTNAQFQRSLSVNSMENKSCVDGKTQSSAPNLGNTQRIKRVPISFRYMRNKPTVIALKTPSFEGHRDDIILQSVGTDRMAEEGRSSGKNGDGDNYDVEANELHPIMGTTRTSREELAIGRPLEIYLDGPYGAPSSHIFRAEHAVLIATGIGVTPFASILQSIMHRYWASRVCCPNCNFTWCGDLPQSVLNLKKVDFFWINRDQRSFEWFVHLLSQLEIEQAELGGAMERFLDMHMYITSALQRTDMKAVGLQLALDLLHEKEKRDLITGLKTRTNAGRPNWNKIFKQLADQHKGKVTVFYCGPPTLARSLKFKCDEFGFSFRKELF